jgi:predicted transcriptional regulator
MVNAIAEKKTKTGMGRKTPEHYQKTMQVDSPQEAIWTVMRELKTFCIADISLALVKKGCKGINDGTIKDYLNRLLRGSYIVFVSQKKKHGLGVTMTYKLINDCGRECPRLNKKGEAVTQGLGQDELWRGMKVLGEFTYVELLAVTTAEAAVKPGTARTYIKHLVAAGYLKCTEEGNATRPSRYRLLPRMNTGPKPPQVKRIHQIYDPNLKKVMPLIKQKGESV